LFDRILGGSLSVAPFDANHALDGIPESDVLGMSLITGGGVSGALLSAI
jgi:hypothetical protein